MVSGDTLVLVFSMIGTSIGVLIPILRKFDNLCTRLSSLEGAYNEHTKNKTHA